MGRDPIFTSGCPVFSPEDAAVMCFRGRGRTDHAQHVLKIDSTVSHHGSISGFWEQTILDDTFIESGSVGD